MLCRTLLLHVSTTEPLTLVRHPHTSVTAYSAETLYLSALVPH